MTNAPEPKFTYVLTTSPLFSMSGPPFTIVGAFSTVENAMARATWLDTWEDEIKIEWQHHPQYENGLDRWTTARSDGGARRFWTIHQTWLDKVEGE